MNPEAEKAVAFATAAVAQAIGDNVFVELREEHDEWTEFRNLRNHHLVAWSRMTSASLALSPAGTVVGWVVDKRLQKGSTPALADDEVERRARLLVRQFREDQLVKIERVPVDSGGSYAVARFAGGWVAINHEDGSLLGYMPGFSGTGKPLKADDSVVPECVEAAWAQLEKDLSRELDADDIEHFRESLHVSVTGATLQSGGVRVCALGLWSFYSTLDVAIDTSTGEIVRWYFDALSEAGAGAGDDETAVVRAARALVRDYSGLQGPSVTWRDNGPGGRYARVDWWHLEDQVNVEGDYVAAMVSGGTGQVFSLSVKWRDVPLPRLRAASRVSSTQAQAIADERMAGASDRFRPGNLVGLNIIQVPDADEPTPVTDRLVWRIRYGARDRLSLVEVSVDCETGEIVRTTGW